MGNDKFQVMLRKADGQAVTDVQQVTLSFASFAVTAGSETIRLKKVSAGDYETIVFSLKGKGFKG